MYEKNFMQLRRGGSVLPLMIIAMVLLLVTGIGMLRMGFQARVYAARNSDEIAAQVAADAGLTMAVASLNQRLAKRTSETPLPRQADVTLANSCTTVSYETAEPDSSVTAAWGAQMAEAEASEELDPSKMAFPFVRGYVIKSVGESGSSEEVVYATVRLKGLFESAILALEELELAPNVVVSGYNSADPSDTHTEVKIGTTGTKSGLVSFDPGAVVEGDVFVGVAGSPAEVIDSKGTVTGRTYALAEQISFPTVTAPALPNIGTAISAKGETVRLWPSDSGTYSEIKLSAKSSDSGVLEIVGGKVTLHLTGQIDLGNDSEIIVRAGSSLVLYIDGDIKADNSAGFVNENSGGTSLKIFATGPDKQTFELRAKSETFGAVYAPNADVELYPKGKLCGAVTGMKVTIKSEGTFLYDEALRDVQPGDEGVRFVIDRWWEQ